MRIRNIGMLLNPSPCQFAAAVQHDAVIRRAHDLFAALVCFLGGSESRRVLSTRMSGDPMKEILPEGGVVRKLWIGETAKYRDHLLRLDAQSRRNRFSGGVSDEFIRNYVDLTPGLDAVVHGFFVGDTMRGAAELRPLGARFPREAEAAFSVEKDWQSQASARYCCAARCWRHATAASAFCTWPVLPITSVCSSWRANLTPSFHSTSK